MTVGLANLEHAIKPVMPFIQIHQSILQDLILAGEWLLGLRLPTGGPEYAALQPEEQEEASRQEHDPQCHTHDAVEYAFITLDLVFSP